MRRAHALEAEGDISALFKGGNDVPVVLSAADLLNLNLPEPGMLIESVLPADSATLLVAAAKTGKTLVSVAIGIAVATGASLFDKYRVRQQGPVMMLEQDDPRGATSVRDILKRSATPLRNAPFSFVGRVPFSFGEEFIEWLEKEIVKRGLKLCILDSYTSLRGPRKSGIDIVKAEQMDLSTLDELATRTHCAILIVHHGSKGSSGMGWTEQAAGTFAMASATEGQIHMSRFTELEPNAPERLVRVRVRHGEDKEVLLRFRKDTLDFAFALEGAGASLYPLIRQIRAAFSSGEFSPKKLCEAVGVSRATAHRQIDRLCLAGVLGKRGYGDYALERGVD